MRVRTLRGFTLVELLVAMVLLSLVALGMGSALRTTAQTEERVDARLQRADDLRVAAGFLRAVLGRVSMAKTAAPLAAGETPYFFRGAAQQMSWLGVMPARYGAGGRYHFRLALEPNGAGTALVLRYAPWADDALTPDWNSAQRHVLAEQATALSIRYQDAQPEPPVWAPQWAVAERLPQRVAVSVQTAQGAWPDIVAALRVLPVSDPSARGAVFGGTMQ